MLLLFGMTALLYGRSVEKYNQFKRETKKLLQLLYLFSTKRMRIPC